MLCGDETTTKRSPSANAHAANTDASARAASTRVSAVEINPQFVVVRNFFELDSTVRAVKAGPLPPRSTVYDGAGRLIYPNPIGVDFSANGNITKPNRADGDEVTAATDVNRQTSTASTATASGSAQRTNTSGSLPAPQGNAANVRMGVNDQSSVPAATPSSPAPPCAGDRGLPGTSPLFSNGAPHTGPGSPQGSRSRAATPAMSPNAPGWRASEASPTRSKSPRPASRGTARTMLCIWDVDDTLVASGAAGVRQNALFAASELVPLFKALPNTRHLLLSQGSIDDVFYPHRGRLRYLQKYFFPDAGDATAAAGAGASGAGDDNASVVSATSSQAGGEKKKKKSSGSIFSCGGTKEKTRATDPVTTFEKGTALVRLTTVRGCPEEPTETRFMYDAAVRPKLHGNSSKDHIRWLVLRPSTWGITLATLNSLFSPSENAACVDGKVFHKMDVAWSLACSGLWDSVFFIDNNLSEVGIVKPGMNMNNVLELQHTHNMYKFFHAEFLLLAASAKLRQLEKQHGRDVTVPPPGWKGEGSHVGRGGGDSSTKPAGEANGRGGRTEDEDDEDHIPTLGERAATQTITPQTTQVSTAKDDGGGGDEDISLASSDSDTAAAARNGRTSVSPPPSAPAAAAAGAASPSAGRRPLVVDGGIYRQVDLVVAHLHMPTERYRQILLGNRSGTDIGTRNSDIRRSTGQPTFIGDTSLTDDQYDAVLAFFRREESAVYQLMDEDMRVNGFVDVGDRRKFSPGSQYVHIPVFRRPYIVPHMRRFYERLCSEVEERVVQPLLKGGGLIRGASVIRGDAHILCTQLLRAGPFLDSQTQGELAHELFMVYAAEGNVEKASGEYVRKAARKLSCSPTDNGKHKKK